MPQLILASTSRYRRDMLQRLGLHFDIARPEVDESPLPGESAIDLAIRLGRAKAQAIAATLAADAWVLGSDQTADVLGAVLGKPGNRARAITQLEVMSGRTIRFHTSVALAHRDGRLFEALDLTEVSMRTLQADEIERYVDAEQPFDCAGSFKSEGLGISLFDAIHSRDPTALIGLPLIATAQLLRRAGFRLP